MPYFKTMAYTEYAGSFYLQPLNFKMRNEQMIDAWHDNESEVARLLFLVSKKSC